MDLMNINSIDVDNRYLRLDSDVEMLMKSIETVGLINPLVLNKDNKLIAGGRRYTALKQLGIEEVPIVKLDKSDLEQELISIDENLVRLDLNKMQLEKSLSRGRELYEELFPTATKFLEEDLTIPAAQEIQKDLPNEKRSFIDLTAEKTGLSKRVIKSAIEREEKASPNVKKLRSHGELNATQTNEIIKLKKEDQEKIAALIPHKTAKEIKEIVKKIKMNGVEVTLNEVLTTPSLPTELKSLQTLLTRSNKVLSKILFEQIKSEHDEMPKILDAMTTLRLNLDQFLELCAAPSTQSSLNSTDETENIQTNPQ